MMHGENAHTTALVTGATGFVGSHLARRLVAEGWQVHIIARNDSHLVILKEVAERVTVHRHDGTTGGMFSIIERSRPAVVFHLASLFLAQHRHDDIEPLIASNVLFSTQLVEAMTTNGVFRLINTGTSWQHYENRAYSPVCLYAATKQAFDAILRYYVETTPLKAITLKLFDTYGPDDPRPKLFAHLRKTASEQVALEMSPGEQLIDLVYIDDVIDAYLNAAERLLTGDAANDEVYAVSSGTPVKLRELVELYGKIIGRSLPVVWGARPYRMREVMAPWNSGLPLPGWRAAVNLEEGIRKMEDAERGAPK